MGAPLRDISRCPPHVCCTPLLKPPPLQLVAVAVLLGMEHSSVVKCKCYSEVSFTSSSKDNNALDGCQQSSNREAFAPYYTCANIIAICQPASSIKTRLSKSQLDASPDHQRLPPSASNPEYQSRVPFIMGSVVNLQTGQDPGS